MKKQSFIALCCATALLTGCSFAGIDLSKYDSSTEDTSSVAASENASSDNASSEGTSSEENTDTAQFEGEVVPAYKRVYRADYKYSNDEAYEPILDVKNEVIMLDGSLESEFSGLASALKAGADEMINGFDARTEELYNDALEMYNTDPAYFNKEYETSSVGITRSDGMFLSYCDYYECYLGGAHGYAATYGHNYFVATGEEVILRDLIAGSEEDLNSLIIDKLYADNEDAENTFIGIDETLSHYKFTPDPQKDITSGADDYEIAYNWYMDQDGIHIIFNAYDIADYASGAFDVCLAYDEDIVVSGYAFDKSKGYCYNEYLPLYAEDEAFENDGLYFKYQGENDEYGIYVESLTLYNGDNSATFEDCYLNFDSDTYSLNNCYHIVTAGGKEYLYLMAGDENDYYGLYVFDITDGGCSTVDSTWFAEVYIDYDGDEKYVGSSILSNPNNMVFGHRCDGLGTFCYYNYFSVGEDGMPKAHSESCKISYVATQSIVSKKDIEMEKLDDTMQPTGEMVTVPSGTKMTIEATDGESWIDVKLSDGSYNRIHIENFGYEGTIGGVAIQDLFEELIYVG